MKDFLENLLKNDITPLKNFIINDLLNEEETSEDIYDYMVNVVSIGGEQGVIISLIYGKDTEEFCKSFLDEILEMLDDFCKNTGYVPVRDFTYSNLAWWTYEQVVKEILYEYGNF